MCGVNKWCNDVSKECDTCDSPKFIWNYKCLNKCPEGYYKFVDEKGQISCIKNCEAAKSGTFGDAASRECKECDKSCKRCEGAADKCVFPCAVGYVYQNYKCIKECPDGWFSYGVDDS